MLERMWRKGNLLALLVGMQTGTATLENSVEVPQEVKNGATLQLSKCTTLQHSNCSIYPKDTDVVKCQDTCTPMFIAAMSTIAKLWKEPRYPSKDEWIKKMQFMYTMEYSSAIRNDKYPPFASTWMELEGIMLSEISQSKRTNIIWSHSFGEYKKQ